MTRLGKCGAFLALATIHAMTNVALSGFAFVASEGSEGVPVVVLGFVWILRIPLLPVEDSLWRLADSLGWWGSDATLIYLIAFANGLIWAAVVFAIVAVLTRRKLKQKVTV